jgi:hypothetical protein
MGSLPGSLIIAAVYLVAAVLSILAFRGCARHLGHSLPDWRRLAGIAAIFTVVVSWSGLAANGLFAAIWSAFVSLGLLRHYVAVDTLAAYWMKSTLFAPIPINNSGIHVEGRPRVCTAVASLGRCNTIQCVDSTMLPQKNPSVWLYSVKLARVVFRLI